jgi:Tfp pilus assembly protein PilX
MKHFHRSIYRRRRGGGLVVAMVTLLVVTTLMGSVIRSLLVELRQSRQDAAQLQAQWLAEAAIERAQSRLRSNRDYSGETWVINLSPGANSEANASGVVEIGVVKTTVERGSEDQPTRVAVTARYPDDPRRRVQVERIFSIPVQKNDLPATNTRQEIVP